MIQKCVYQCALLVLYMICVCAFMHMPQELMRIASIRCTEGDDVEVDLSKDPSDDDDLPPSGCDPGSTGGGGCPADPVIKDPMVRDPVKLTRVPKIYYATRTHSQIAQVVRLCSPKELVQNPSLQQEGFLLIKS